MKYYFSQIFIVLILNGILFSQNPNKGLYFTGILRGQEIMPFYDSYYDEMTSLVLSKQGLFILSKDFSLEFDFPIQKITNFGPIFIAYYNDETIFNLVYAYHQNIDSSYLNFYYGNENIFIYKIKKSEISKSKWYKFKLTYSFSQKFVEVKIEDKSNRKNISLNKDKLNFELVFGLNKFMFDCPRMVLKDVKIIDEQSKELLHYWPLDETEGNIAHDREGGKDGVFNKGMWVKANNFKYHLIATFDNTDGFTVSYNPKTNRVYLSTRDSIIKYNLNNNQAEIILTNHNPKIFSGPCVHDTIRNIMYCITRGAKGDIDIYYEEKNYWQLTPIIPNDSGRYYDCKYFYAYETDSLYALGGYGWYTYRNNLLSYDFKNKKWINIPIYGDYLIPGRFYSVFNSEQKNKYYVFGGNGNPVGDQFFGHNDYFNLYLLDIKTKYIKSIYSGPKNTYKFLSVAENFDLPSKLFFAIKKEKNSKYTLAGIYKDKPEFEIFGDTISTFPGYNLLENISLFFDKENKEFVIVAQYEESKTGKIHAAIMTLSYPPIKGEEFNILAENSRVDKGIPLWVFILAFAVIGLISLAILQRAGIKIIPKKLVLKSKKNVTPENIQKKPIDIQPKNENSKVIKISTFGEFSICFNNQEITSEFSQKQKELFLIILLHNFGVNNQSGISTTQLTDALWPHLDKTGSKNTRGVIINQLRKKLSEVPDIKIVSKNSKWYIELSENVECDFQKYMEFKALNNGLFGDEEIRLFNELVAKGKFLKQIDFEWLDSIKNQVIFDVTSKLHKFAKVKYQEQDFETLLEISNSILVWDPVDEFGIICKIQALNRLGRHSLAKEEYNLFRNLYNKIYDINYDKTFEKILAENVSNL